MSLQVARRGSGPDLVLLHGWGMNPGVWSGLPAHLTRGYRQHRIALPGHAGSPIGPGAQELAGWASACLAAAPDRALWVGWSLGGLVSLAAALQAPQRVRALILITTSPCFTRRADWPSAMPIGTLDQFQANLLADPAGTLERFLALQVRGSDAALPTLRWLRSEIRRHPAPNAGALAAGLRLLRESDLRALLSRLVPDSLWLFGGRDTLVPAALGEHIAGLAARARVRVIAGSGHAPFLSHPDATSEAIGDFLAEAGS